MRRLVILALSIAEYPAPEVLSGSEMSRLLAHAPSLEHRALFVQMYRVGP